MQPGGEAHASGPVLLTAPSLAHVPHGFTNRHGGQSVAPYDSLDLKLGELPGRTAVRENRKRVLLALGRPASAFVAVKQVHGDHIVEVTAQASAHIEADGIWTRDAKAVLAILTADCVPILMADAQGRVVAAVHAGWRGTCARIATRMLERLQAAAHVLPQDMRVAIGPAIGPCCFDIGHDTAALLRQAYPQAQTAIGIRKNRKSFADLWELNVQALGEAGVLPAHTSVHRVCTMCTQAHYSYRRDAGMTGRQAGVVALR